MSWKLPKSHLQNAERLLAATQERGEQLDSPAVEMAVVDEEQFRSLPASLASARAYLAQSRGDVPGTVKYGRRALELHPEGDHLQRGVAAAILGLAYWESGDLEAAHSTLADGMANMRTAGNILFAMRGTYILADIQIGARSSPRSYPHL